MSWQNKNYMRRKTKINTDFPRFFLHKSWRIISCVCFVCVPWLLLLATGILSLQISLIQPQSRKVLNMRALYYFNIRIYTHKRFNCIGSLCCWSASMVLRKKLSSCFASERQQWRWKLSISWSSFPFDQSPRYMTVTFLMVR